MRLGKLGSHAMKLTVVVLSLLALARRADAAQLLDGVLMVDGKPFYPLGSWTFSHTTLDDIDTLGLNVAFRGVPGSEQGVTDFRQWMRQADQRGLQVVPFLSYGGSGSRPWPTENVRRVARLASEPNLLAWYVGDDIGIEHLPGIRQTVTTLRQEAPGVPAVADYIDRETPEAKETYTRFIDIRCQYTYPIPIDPIATYMTFFDEQREFVGDPLWTWIQLFMWDMTALKGGFGSEGGPGPVPDPSQVRLLCFAAINRGVRGLLFFPHQEFHLRPEFSPTVGQVCREVRLVSSHLAAGERSYNLTTSDSTVNATAFTYGGSVVVSAMVVKPTYHRWVDEAVVRNVTIDVPWEGSGLPTAHLVATPDVVDCVVQPGERAGTVRVALPSLELAGLVLVTADSAEVSRLRQGVLEAIPKLAGFALIGSYVEARKVSEAAWGAAFGSPYEGNDLHMRIHRTNEEVFRAYQDGRYADELRLWHSADRMGRAMLDSMVRFAESRRDAVPREDRRFLDSPYSLYRLVGLKDAPRSDDPWHFVRHFLVTGPFPLERDVAHAPTAVPPGFDRVYAPETSTDLDETFRTMDGPATWMASATDLSGRLDFLKSLQTTTNAVCYARAVVIAPRDTATTLSIGSNDGVKVWVNGEVAFSWSSAPTGGRGAQAHQNSVPVQLHAGRNTVLAKVENLGKNWQLFLSFHDPHRVLSYEVR